jgi:preprotein translocase subunit Sss1
MTISREIDEFTKVVKGEFVPRVDEFVKVAKVIAVCLAVEAVCVVVIVILSAVIAARVKR